MYIAVYDHFTKYIMYSKSICNSHAKMSPTNFAVSVVLIYASLFQNAHADIIGTHISEVGKLEFCGIAEKNGFRCESYEVTTEDGYVLTVFRMPGDPTRPVLCVHGLADTSDTFIIREKNSLALVLANKGYDVWATNARGNRYSSKSIKYSPDSSVFWNFTFNEQSKYDIPAVIDFALAKTGQVALHIIGHSQGTQVFFSLGYLRPEYTAKIKLLIALAPVCFLNYNPPPVSTLIKSAPALDAAAILLNKEEFFKDNSTSVNIIKYFCTQGVLGDEICNNLVLGEFAGHDPSQLEPDDFADTIYGHYPSSTSRKNLAHLGQIGNRKKFAQFDYGPIGNLKEYNQLEPPEYDLKKVTMKVALLAGRRDRLADMQDVEFLYPQLPNVVNYTIISRPECNHLDFVWGLDMWDYLFPIVLELLDRYKE